MKTFTTGLVFFLALTAITSQATAGVIFSERVNLGSDAGNFFEPGSGFSEGDTSHTNSISVVEMGIKLDVTLTVEGFDEAGGAAGLYTTGAAVGVDGAGTTVGERSRVNPGEAVKDTYDSIDFSLMPASPGLTVDPASFGLLSTIRLAAFDVPTDTFTYSGVGAVGHSGDDTTTIEVYTMLSDGDMSLVTGDSGEFRVQYLSLGAMANIVPEPTTALLCLAMFGSAACLRRRK